MNGLFRYVSLSIAVAFVFLLSSAVRGQDDFLPADEIEPGMEGYGLTVFEGGEIERFGAKIIDVMPDYFPGQDMILIEVDHEITDHAKVIGGMSGSPIYLETEESEEPLLVGAISYQLAQFPKDPIAGVTPIRNMVEASAYGGFQPGDSDSQEDQGGDQGYQPDGPFPVDQFDGQLEPLGPQLSISGVPPSVIEKYREDFEELGLQVRQGGSGGRISGENLSIEPGAAAGIALMEGDMQMAASGTVTHVEGDRVLMFGHGFMGTGKAELPLKSSYVHTVLASQSSSFKLASTVEDVGTVTFDHQSAVGGELGPTRARMIPLDVQVEFGEESIERSYSSRMVNHPNLTPLLLSSGLSGAFQQSVPSGYADVTTDYTLTIETEEFGTLEWDNKSAGTPAIQVMGLVGNIVNNPFDRRVDINQIDVDMDVALENNQVQIERAWPDTGRVSPGQQLGINVQLVTPDGDREIVRREIDLPEGLHAGNYEIYVSSQQGAPGPQYRPRSMETYLPLLTRNRRADRLEINLKLPRMEVTVGGRVMEDVPPSVAGALAGERMTELSIRNKFQTEVLEMDRVVSGSDMIQIRVDNP